MSGACLDCRNDLAEAAEPTIFVVRSAPLSHTWTSRARQCTAYGML